MATKHKGHSERSFGLSVGGVLCALAALLTWRGRTTQAEALGGIGVVLVLFGLVHPRLLRRPSDLWWRFAQALGYVNTRILLTLFYAVALVPLGILWRVIGTDPLERRRGKGQGWSPYPARYRDSKHYVRMY